MNRKMLTLVGVAVIAAVIIGAGFIETCVEYEWEEIPCFDDPENRAEPECSMQKRPECTNFWSSIMQSEPEKNTKPINGTQAVIDHPKFKELKGIPSTLKIGGGGADESDPPIFYSVGCFQTETGEVYRAGYTTVGSEFSEAWVDVAIEKCE